ncbi:CTP synthase (glutamine hydrolyzing) [Candidatus Microgenomates bacterium]|nr:CTP synthase (glutamine hydrolyzing) [Candidatus Microgenomates bacterium]
MPAGYQKGRTKFVVVVGTVMSGLGKGIFSSSLGKLLQDNGLKCVPIKMEGYLNLDSGTLNPYRHGEVFVLDDGTECDMDLGTYERTLESDLTRDSFITSGQIFSKIFEKERKGEYLGRDVQIIPHVTGEIKWHLRNLAQKSGADIILVEVGGTIGDIENSHYIESLRQLNYEEGESNVCFVALTYIAQPNTLGEQKSKPAQLGIRLLLEAGIQPHLVACRSEKPTSEKVREKISIYTNVPMERVFSMHDVESIYTIPQLLNEVHVDDEILRILKIKKKKNAESSSWHAFASKLGKKSQKVTIGIAGKYTDLRDSYASIIKALEHAGISNGVAVEIDWIDVTEIERNKKKPFDLLAKIDGLIVPGGFGKRGAEGKIACVRFARENKIPYLGICLGFQMALIEFARNVLGLEDAHTTEIDHKTPHPVVCILPSQKNIKGLGGSMRLGGRDLHILGKSQAFNIYSGKKKIRERFRHRYECNPEYIKKFEEKGMIFSGFAPKEEGEIMQILELPDHPFFIGTQFHPEFTSRPLSPQPLFVHLVATAMKRKG